MKSTRSQYFFFLQIFTLFTSGCVFHNVLLNLLQDWPTTLLIVSHDKKFLNEVATDILHQHSRRIDAYRGNYDQFFKTKTEKLKNQNREYEAQMQFRAHAQVRCLFISGGLILLWDLEK